MSGSAVAAAKLLSVVCLAASFCSCSRKPDGQERPAPPRVLTAQAAVFSLPDLFDVTLPGTGRWEPVTNARRLGFSPPAVLLLVNEGQSALIRFSLYESDAVTPRDLIAQFKSQLEAAGYLCRQVIAAVGDDAPASIAFIGPESGSRRGKVFIGRLPGNAGLSVVVIGQWDAAADALVTADFDSIAASLKAPAD